MNLTEVYEFTEFIFKHGDGGGVTREGLHTLKTTVQDFILIVLLSQQNIRMKSE